MRKPVWIVNFFKGIVAGFGGIAPGLSGTVLLIIMGLYRDVLDALGTIFRDFRKKILFLLPVVAGMFLGVLLFSKVLDSLLEHHEMVTRFCFLGMILGTVPMLFQEVKKEGFPPFCPVLILVAGCAGLWLFTLSPNTFPQIPNPNFLQCVFLGVGVAASAIIPGVDPAVLLSTLGLYEAYVNALAALDLSVLLPMLIGLAIGGVLISLGISQLFRRFYTVTFSIVFGLFLSMIPNILDGVSFQAPTGRWCAAMILMVLGFILSYLLGNVEFCKEIFANLKRKKL